jgi:DNA-binding Lrp family transcriptional regulator
MEYQAELQKDSELLSHDPNHEKMAEMVKLIAQRGPRINEIATVIGVHKETVRYWYRNMLKCGFTVHAARNQEKLGMKRVVMIVELGETFDSYADSLMYALGDLCYVVSFAKTLPDGFYSVNASVPTECLDSWTDFILSLKEMGVFKSITSIVLDWVRNPPMKAEMYDFHEGRWNFDWNDHVATPEARNYEVAERERFDLIDLGIIEQLQLDANTQLIDMQEKLKTNRKTLSYHYHGHVLRRGLIKGYMVNWIGTRYDYKAEKPIHRKHRYTPVEIFASELNQAERVELIRKVGQLPYTWLEGAGRRSYYAKVVFPNDEITEALEFLGELVKPLKSRIRCFTMDQAHALWFTLPKQYYDQKEPRWTFNQRDLMQRFEVLVQKVRGATG